MKISQQLITSEKDEADNQHSNEFRNAIYN